MPNTFVYTDTWIAMEGLDILLNKLGITQHFNKEYSRQFKLRHPVGDTIRVPFPDRGRIREGLTYNPTAIQRRYTEVSLQEPFGEDFEWDDIEELLYTKRGRDQAIEEVIQPRMAEIAQEIDNRATLYAYQNSPNVVGSLATDPSSYDGTSGAARQIFAEMACPPEGERGIFVRPAVMRAVKASNIALHNPVTDISKQFRTGIVQHADGFDWYESMSLYRHTAGSWNSAVTVNATQTGSAAISSLVVSCTSGDTFKKGDKFSIGSVYPVNPMTRRRFGTSLKTFSVTADVTASASTATITFTPPIYGPDSVHQNVDALPQASAALTLWPGTTSPNGKEGIVGVAIHPLAFAMVGLELPTPKASSVEIVSQKRDPKTGISVRFIRQFDGRASKYINRFDVCIGFGTFYNDSCSAAIAQAG